MVTSTESNSFNKQCTATTQSNTTTTVTRIPIALPNAVDSDTQMDCTEYTPRSPKRSLNASHYGTAAAAPTVLTSEYSKCRKTANDSMFSSSIAKSTFGATPAATSFGNTFGTPSTGFGSAPVFGSAPPNQLFPSGNTTSFGSGGLFSNNQNQPTSTGLFTSHNAGFMQQNKPSFGFGTSTPLFGQQQQPQQNQSTSMFQPSTSGSVFGTPNAFGVTQSGTCIKFNPVTGSDTMQKSGVAQTISTKHHCITCMKEYEGKSLEELRWEDYQCNRKGPGQQPGFGNPPFGSAAPAAPSIFGQADNKPGFGQSFGQPTTGFGMPNQNNQNTGFFKPTTGFGTATNPTTFGFSAPPAANPFAVPSAAKPFGTTGTQNIFGSTPTSQTGGFGNNPFGQPAVQSTPFMNKQPSQTNGFGANQSVFAFGAQPPPTSGTNMFQNSKPATGFNFFNPSPNPVNFGTQPLAFGQTNQNAFQGFGKQAQPFAQPAQNTFGLGAPQAGNLFGNTSKPGGMFGNTTLGGGNNFFGNNSNFQMQPGYNFQPQQLQQPTLSVPQDIYQEFRTIMHLSAPFGVSKHLDGLEPLKESSKVHLTSVNDVPHLQDQPKRINLTPPEKPKLILLANKKPHMFDHILENPFRPGMQVGRVKQSPKRLILKNKPETRVPFDFDEASEDYQESALTSVRSIDSNRQNKTSFFEMDANFTVLSGIEPLKTDPRKDEIITRYISPEVLKRQGSPLTGKNRFRVEDHYELHDHTEFTLKLSDRSSIHSSKTGFDYDDSDLDDVSTATDSSTTNNVPQKQNPCGIIMTRAEYFTIPPLNEIYHYLDAGKCVIKGFTVGRLGYGNIYFRDAVDVSNLNIDRDVHFRHREVTLYPDDQFKPPVGSGLNTRAQVTLDRVWPRGKDKKYVMDIDELIRLKYSDILRNVCGQYDTQFVDYRPETGSWVFIVDHFSKYGFTDEDEEAYMALLDKKLCEKEEKELLENEELTMESAFEDIKDLPITKSMKTFSIGNMVMAQSLFDEADSFDEVYSTSILDYESIQDNLDVNDIEIYKTEGVPQKSKAYVPTVYQLLNRNPESIMVDNRNYMDFAIFKGKCFKVGWGAGFNLFVLESCSVAGKMVQQSSRLLNPERAVVNLQVNNKVSTLDDCLTVSLDKYMRVVLSCCDVNTDETGVPSMKPKINPNYLASILSVFNDLTERCPSNEQYQYIKHILRLCDALWGEQTNHTHKTRCEAFSEWLEAVVSTLVEKQLMCDITNNVRPSVENIYTLLSGHKITEAAELAMKMKLPQMSILITTLTSYNLSKAFIREQLKDWKKSILGIDNRIMDDAITRIYLLLSGNFITDNFNLCESIDWTRALGMYLWYAKPTDANLAYAVKEYTHAMNNIPGVVRPYPAYQENNEFTYDVLYNIILLYTRDLIQLKDMLRPDTHTSDALDYRLSWILLNLFKSLQVGCISEAEENHIHTKYASQLENMGCWKWSIFVLLHLKDPVVKKEAVLKILYRNLDSEQYSEVDKNTKTLVNEMKVPTAWINRVCACKLLNQSVSECNRDLKMKMVLQAYRYLSYCEDWNASHDLALTHVIPALVSSTQFDILEKILNVLTPAASTISNWGIGGGLSLDYVNILHLFADENVKLDSEMIQELRRNVVGFFQRLCAIKSKTPQQALCTSELFIALVSLIVRNVPNMSYNLYARFDLNELVISQDYKMRAIGLLTGIL